MPPSFVPSLTLNRAQIQRGLLRAALVALAYFLTGRLGLLLPYLGAHITLIWAPSGIALAALLRWGPAALPGIAIGAFAVAWSVGSPPGLAAALAAGNTLGPWLAALALRRCGFRSALERRHDLVAYLGLGAGAGMAVTALAGTLALAAAGLLPWPQVPRSALIWWLGDAVGALVAGVPLLTLRRVAWRRAFGGGAALGNALLAALTLASGLASFVLPSSVPLSPLVFAPQLFLCWLALRAGLNVASTTGLLLTAAAAWATARGLGPFYGGDPHAGMAMLWGYITALTVLPVLMTVLLSEKAASEERWQLALEGTSAGVGDWDMRGNRVFYSRGWKAMLGYGPEGMGSTYDDWVKLVHPEDRPRLQRVLDEHLAGMSDRVRVQHRLRASDGRWIWFELQGRVVEHDDRGRPLRFIAAATDISDRRASEEQLRLSSHLVQHLHEGLLITDTQHRILHANPAYLRMSGYGRDELVGTVPAVLGADDATSAEDSAARRRERWAALKLHGVWRGEVIEKRRNGEPYPQQVTISAVPNEAGDVEHHVLVVSDITVARHHREQLERQAHYDSLTQLPNRSRLATLLREALAAADRDGHILALAYLDLDHFKPLNDQFGHEAGDRLLTELALRLRGALRGGDAVARLGGDEFVLLLRSDSLDECRQALERVLHVVSQPYAVGMPRSWQVTASIGVTVYPLDRADADTLLRHADHAMYSAKQAGRNCYQFFDPEYDRQATMRRDAADRALAGLAAGEFRLFYQPKIDMRSGDVLGFEALLRWQHPQRGLLPPADFLSLFGGVERAVELGEWVLDAALGQLAQWTNDGLDLTLSVNIAGPHLQRPGFAERLGQHLMRHGSALAHRLELEVLETAALADIESVSEVMQRCRAHGVRFALDDFGTGYSPLTYLKRLPVDTLKIDRSFVATMLSDPQDLAIVEGVISLSRTFGCGVVAEGVESDEQAVRLIAAGCHVGQGYGIASPMPPAQVPDWVDTQHAPGPRSAFGTLVA